MNDNFDLILRLNDGDVAIFREVDKVIAKSTITGSPDPAFKFARGLRRNIQAQGLALVKLLANLHSQWELLKEGGVEEPFGVAVERELGLAVSTTEKYVNMYHAIFDNEKISAEIKAALYSFPLKTLLLLTAAANDNSLDEEDWNEIIRSSSGVEVAQVVRKKRGKQTSSDTRIVLMIDTSGFLKAKIGEDIIVYIGTININSDDPNIRKAVQRLIKSANILEIM